MKLKIRNTAQALLLIAAAALTGSCLSEREEQEMSGRRTGAVRIRGAVAETVETRSYELEGSSNTLKSGRFFMTYSNTDRETYSVCEVNFHETHGVTTTRDGKELKWENIGAIPGDDTQTILFLDNVPPQPGQDYNATTVLFTDDYHPFDAAEYQGDGGPNDLLWGYAPVQLYQTADASIGIHHYMSRVSVLVTVDNSSENAAPIDFRYGSVMITNILTKGIGFDRTHAGAILFDADPAYEDLSLASKGDWKEVTRDDLNPTLEYFHTKNFVVPPQQLRTDDLRPRLVLEVPQSDGSIRTYSGVIPRVMMVNGSPAALAFDPEKNLTLKVKISQDRLRIESIVAYVQDWVNKGSFLVSADHAFIGSTEDLMNLIAIYQEQDYEQIKQYGYRHVDADGTVTWSFNIFGEPRIEVEKVTEKMGKPSPDFSFDMTSHRFTLIYADGTKRRFGSYETTNYEAARNAEKILHDLLRFGTVPDPKDGTDPNNDSGGGDVDVEIGVGDN